MKLSEIETVVGKPGTLLPDRFTLFAGEGLRIQFENGKVEEMNSYSPEGSELYKKIDLGMTEQEVRRLLGSVALVPCRMYHWGNHRPPFAVYVSDERAYYIIHPSEADLDQN